MRDIIFDLKEMLKLCIISDRIAYTSEQRQVCKDILTWIENKE